MENNVVVDDYSQMDRILREERNYILQTIKKIRATGCNVVLIQKSILRDAVTDLSLHYLVRFCSSLDLLLARRVHREALFLDCT
jgi:T-complex protein 1 subunit delta